MSYPGGYYLHVSRSFVIICRKLELGHCEYMATEWQNWVELFCQLMSLNVVSFVSQSSSVQFSLLYFLPYRRTKKQEKLMVRKPRGSHQTYKEWAPLGKLIQDSISKMYIILWQHMWLEFVVSSLVSCERLFSGFCAFPFSPKKTQI